jgi:FkbM family methyltransferase
MEDNVPAMIISKRGKVLLLLAALMFAAGLGLVKGHFSLRCRKAVVSEKLAERLPYLGWGQVVRLVLSPGHTVFQTGPALGDSVALVTERRVEGRTWELYRTTLGEFWVRAPGRDTVAAIDWELTVQHVYQSGVVRLRAGDTVIDCGAHIGMFTRYALRQGARRVVAIEPDPINLACLEANLASEIAAGQVIVIKAGVWDRKDYLTLFLGSEDWGGDGQSFVSRLDGNRRIEGVPVLPLDDIVAQLKLDRVDFIKMDIEGSERHALEGAEQTLRRFMPRMAICSYHLFDDPAVLPAIVLRVQPTYRIHAKDVAASRGGPGLTPKVLFFQ